MDTRLRDAIAVALVAASGLLGLGAVDGAPTGGQSVGIWPIALGTVACLLVARPLIPVLLIALGASDAGALLIAGRPMAYAVLVGAGLAASSGVAWWILVRGSTGAEAGRRPALRTMTDVGLLMRAAILGGSVLAAAGLAAGLLTDARHAAMTAFTLGLSAVAAQVSWLPLACRMRPRPAPAGALERGGQWIVLLATSALVFIPADSPPLVILLFPVLAWICLRGNSVDARAQLVALQVVAITCTNYGRGPLARPDRYFPVPLDTQTLLVAVFVIVTAMQVVVLAVTVGEQSYANHAVAAERDRLRRIVESISAVAIIGSDPHGVVTLFNPGAEKLLGYTADEVVGRSSRMLHSPESVAAKGAELGVGPDFGDVARAVLDKGPTEMGFRRKDGAERHHLMSLHRVLDDAGELTGHVSTSEDITDLVHTQATLVEALEAERTASDRLRELDRVKDVFVSSVSHELRTPLTSILGYVELLQDGECGELVPEQSRAVERIRTNSRRLVTLISDLLDLSRLEEQQAGFDPVPVDLVETTRIGVRVSTAAAAARGVRVMRHLPTEPQVVLGDREQLERVVINLVDNAIKFSPPGARVDVRLEAAEGAVVLTVADSGIGVPEADQPRLFDRFFRSSAAQQQAVPGSGLGLSITHEIVVQHGGRIDVTSEENVGTTFTVTLPAAVQGPRPSALTRLDHAHRSVATLA